MKLNAVIFDSHSVNDLAQQLTMDFDFIMLSQFQGTL